MNQTKVKKMVSNGKNIELVILVILGSIVWYNFGLIGGFLFYLLTLPLWALIGAWLENMKDKNLKKGESMGFFGNMLTSKGVKVKEGSYVYTSNTEPYRVYDFHSNNGGLSIDIINHYDGSHDLLKYQKNGTYTTATMTFAFHKSGENTYMGGLLGKNMGTAVLK